jgi:D-alanyl-D-alanine carboxypeptidase
VTDTNNGLSDNDINKLSQSMSASVGRAVADALNKQHEKASKGKGYVSLNSDDLDDFKEGLHNLVKGVKESQPGFKTLAQAASGAQMSIQDNAGAFQSLQEAILKARQEIEETSKAIKESKDTNKIKDLNDKKRNATEKEEAAKAARNQLLFTTITNAGITAVANYTNALIDNSMSMANIAYDFKESLLSGTTATDLYSQSVQASNKANSEYTSQMYKNGQMLAELFAGLGILLAPFSLGLSLAVTAAAGAAAVYLSGADNYQKKTAELANREIAFQGHRLKLVEDSYREITQSGTVLAQGMTELVYQSSRSGFTMKEFADGLKASKDQIKQSGITSDEFARRLASTGQELHAVDKNGKNLAMTLDKLGYSGQEQLELQADVISQLKRSANPQLADDYKYVAQQTVELGKNYKVLNLIVGENSREAMKKHREEAAQANLVAKYGSDEISQKKLQFQLAAAQAGGYSKLYKEILNYGHAVSADTIIQQNQNRSLTEAIFKQRDLLLDSSKQVNTNEFNEVMSSSFAAIGSGAQEFINANKIYVESITLASEKLGGPVADGVTALSQQALISQTFTDQIYQTFKQNIKDASENKNALDAELARAEENRRKMAAAQDGDIKALEGYAKNVADMSGKFTGAGDKLISAVSGLADSIAGKTKETKEAEAGAINRNLPRSQAAAESQWQAIKDALLNFFVNFFGSGTQAGKGRGHVVGAQPTTQATNRTATATTPARTTTTAATPAATTSTTPVSTTTVTAAKQTSPGANETPPTAGGTTASLAPKTKTVRSKTGKGAQIDEKYAGAFQGLVDYLDSVGYQINDLGGYKDRDIRNQPGKKSIHSYAAALDINSATNPLGSQLKTDMPGNIGQIASDLGLGWGGGWKSVKDAMHFSAAKSEGGNLLEAESGGYFKAQTGGHNVKVAEAGLDEAVIPLTRGKMKLDFDELLDKLDEVVQAVNNHKASSDKLLRAMA